MKEKSFQQAVTHENTAESLATDIGKYDNIFLPFYKKYGIEKTFSGANGIPISCRIFSTPNATAKILLTTGYNESFLKYAECITNLCHMGFSVYCFDHRGQGFSGRFPEQGNIAYVDKFEHYIDDIEIFFHYVSSAHDKDLPIFVLSHSMGSAITMLAVCENKIQPTGVILSAPMYEVRFFSWHIFELPVYLIAKYFSYTGREKKFPGGGKDFINARVFEKNCVTHSRARFTVWSKQILANPKMHLKGPSYGWIKEATAAARKLRAIKESEYGPQQGQKRVPVLLLQAEADTVVRNSAQNHFVKNNPYIEKIVFQHAKHELLMEVDFIRAGVLDCIKKFIDTNTPTHQD